MEATWLIHAARGVVVLYAAAALGVWAAGVSLAGAARLYGKTDAVVPAAAVEEDEGKEETKQASAVHAHGIYVGVGVGGKGVGLVESCLVVTDNE